MEYTPIGNVINIASRLEKVNKRFKTKILFRENIFKKVENNNIKLNIKSLGVHKIRGIEEKYELFTLND